MVLQQDMPRLHVPVAMQCYSNAKGHATAVQTYNIATGTVSMYSGSSLIRTSIVRTLDNPNGLESKLIIFTVNNSILLYR